MHRNQYSEVLEQASRYYYLLSGYSHIYILLQDKLTHSNSRYGEQCQDKSDITYAKANYSSIITKDLFTKNHS